MTPDMRRATAGRADRRIIASLVFVGAASILAAGLVHLGSDVAERNRDPVPAARPLNVNAHIAIGRRSAEDWQGNARAKVTLVEFGDYECPPCREVEGEVRSIVKAHGNRLRFEFRNYPIVTAHPAAMNAASLAELARARGCFWSVHDELFSHSVDDYQMQRIAREHSLDTSTRASTYLEARRRVHEDMADASVLGIDSTPSFVLCNSDGKLYSLPSFRNVGDYIARFVGK